MDKAISHDRHEESIEAKARWFQSLTLSERMEMLCAFTDLALTVNPSLQERNDAQSITGRIQVLKLEDVKPLERAEDNEGEAQAREPDNK